MTPSLKEISAFRKVNKERVARGLPKYKWAPLWMLREARAWSRTMANEQSLYHTPGGIKLPNYWVAWGQNVGMHMTVGALHEEFMGSPLHKANILDKQFKRIAIGIIKDANGVVWETQNFVCP